MKLSRLSLNLNQLTQSFVQSLQKRIDRKFEEVLIVFTFIGQSQKIVKLTDDALANYKKI